MNEIAEIHFDGKIAQKAIVSKGEKVLLMRDSREPDVIWELPGGRLNEGEEPRKALQRELREELGAEFAIHEVVHMEQFFQKSDGRNAFVLVYRATLQNDDVEFVLEKGEVLEVGWFTKDEVADLKLFPEYENALIVYFK